MEVIDNSEQGLDIYDEESFRFDPKLSYYLAGPMSGYPDFNFEEFTNAARVLRENDIDVRSPHEIDHDETPETRGSLPYETYMQAGLDLLKTCGGIILLRGWPTSTGAMRELALAIELSLPVYFFQDAWEYRDSADLISMNRRPKP